MPLRTLSSTLSRLVNGQRPATGSRAPRASSSLDRSNLSEAVDAIVGPSQGSALDSDVEQTQERLLAAQYDRWAERYHRSLVRYSRETLAVAIDLLRPVPRRVLDLACGTGLFTAFLHHRLHAHRLHAGSPHPGVERVPVVQGDVDVIGVDMSDAMLSVARSRELRHREGHTVRARYLRGRADEIPLPSRSVQAVLIANAFHLVRDPQAALAECRRVLVPGGTLVMVDWCRDALSMRMLALLLAATQRLKRRIEGLDGLSVRVQHAGFRIDRAFRFRVAPAWGMMAVRATLPTPTDSTSPA